MTSKKSAPAIGSGYAWVIVLVSYIASFTGPMTQFKVAPLESVLRQVFNMDLGTYGLLMTFFAVLGIILAFPTLFIVRKFGLKFTILFSVACLGVGNLIGILVPANPGGLGLLLFSRAIEGIGMGLIGVAAPSAVGIWFVPEKRGFPLGIWATWAPLGMIIVFLAGPAFFGTVETWKNLWWLCFAICVVAFILFALFFKLPSGTAKEDIVITASVKDCFKVLKNRNIWFLGIAFFMFVAFCLGSAANHYGEFLIIHYYGGNMAAMPLAMFFILIFLAFTLVFQPLLGFINDKLKVRKPFLVVSFVFCAVGTIFAFHTDSFESIWAFILIAGFGGAIAGAAVRPLAPEVMEKTALGTTMGMVVLQLFMNLGVSIGSPVFGAVVDSAGGAGAASAWAAAGNFMLIPILVVGMIFSILVKAK